MYLRIDQMVCRPGGDGIELMQCQVSPELKELLEKELEFGVNGLAGHGAAGPPTRDVRAMSGHFEEDLISSFAWIEREDGTLVPVGDVDVQLAAVEIAPNLWLPGVAIDRDVIEDMNLEQGDVLKGVVNE